jgi:sugar lactone lactonase YvrE
MKHYLKFLSLILLGGTIFSCTRPNDPDPPQPSSRTLLPFTVTVSNRQPTTATLSWTAAVNNNNSDVVKYKILLGTTTVATDLTATTYPLTGLTATSTYTGKVMAYTQSGDTASAAFSIGVYTAPIPTYSYVTGYYRVTETTTYPGGPTASYTFAGQAALINDSVIYFTSSRRIPRTWWTADFPTQIYPAMNDSLVGTGITPRGRILDQNTIRMSYLFGSTVVYNVKQLWQKLANPADTATIVYTYPDFSGMITTIAGNSTGGASGSTGDGGLGTAAGLVNPNDVAADAAGNVYLTDGGSGYSIRKVGIDGIITRVAGNNTSGFSGDGGPATAAQLNFPQGIILDNNGNLYISDAGNRVIRKVNSSGIISTIAGTPGVYGYSGDGGQAALAQLGAPAGLAIDASGNIYFADPGKHVIRKIAVNGIITTVAGNGTNGYSGDGGAATSAKLNTPNDVYVDAANNLYIADKSNHAIRKVDASGTITTVAGIGGSLNYGFSGDGGQATAAKLDRPQSISGDASGNLYISDYGNNRIRKVSSSGVITTIAGNGQSAAMGDGPAFYGGDHSAATAAAVGAPYGIFWINSKLYIAATNRIRKIKY